MMDSPVRSSPFQSVFGTVGLHHEKALKAAFYNAAALIFVIMSAVITLSVYYILEVFIRPLVWALLVGAFLHPFKTTMTRYVRDWLDALQVDGIPLVVGLTLLPFQAVNESADFLGWVIKSNLHLLLSVLLSVIFLYYLIVYQPFYYIIIAVQFLNAVVSELLVIFSYPLAIWTIFIGFMVITIFYRRDRPDSVISRSEFMLKYLSVGIWGMMLFHLISLAGAGKVPLAILLIVLIVFGIVSDQQHEVHYENEIKGTKSKGYSMTPTKRRMTIVDVVDTALNVFGIDTNTNILKSDQEWQKTNSQESLADSNNQHFAETTEVMESVKLKNPIVECVKATPNKLTKLSLQLPKQNRKGRRVRRSSDPYFIALFWLFVLSRVWLHTWLLQLLPILISIYILKSLFRKLTLYNQLISKVRSFIDVVKSFYDSRKEVLYPGPVKGSISMVRTGDKKMISVLCNSTDAFMSILMILCLLIVAVLGTTFFAIQVQHEGSYLVTVAINVFNKTIVSNKDYLRWLNLNDSEIRQTFDATVHNGYMVARHKMAVAVSSTLMSKNASSQNIEDEITALLDQLYVSWIAKNASSNLKLQSSDNISNIDTTSKENSDFWGKKWKFFSGFFSVKDLNKVMVVLKENLGTLYSVFDSVWALIKGNANLVFSVIWHVVSLILSSGTYLVNSAVSIIIFTTTLFYLLSSSRNIYKPVEWFSGLSMGTRLGESVDKAIQDVFGASLKMAIFYGFYTWLTHSVLGANLVFIPAAFAAMLGIVPFIGTYWAAVPAALELCLIRDEGLVGLLLLVLHVLPTYVVDTAIYSEIGGHPYLTGLAIAGGVICIGLEGAFVGPFVLCLLVAAFDIYNRILTNSPSAEDISIRKKENLFTKVSS